MRNKVLLAGLVISAVLIVSGLPANALTIDPSTGVIDVSRWEGPQTSQSAIDAVIASYIFPAAELYKDDFGTGESGSLMNSYETAWTQLNDGEPEGAVISHEIGTPYIVPPPAFLLVKDGNQDPAWYLFDLAALSWNGTETLDLQNFWLGPGGAISHVALYGARQSVPEPAIMLLLGSGLVALAGLSRKRVLKV